MGRMAANCIALMLFLCAVIFLASADENLLGTPEAPLLAAGQLDSKTMLGGAENSKHATENQLYASAKKILCWPMTKRRKCKRHIQGKCGKDVKITTLPNNSEFKRVGLTIPPPPEGYSVIRQARYKIAACRIPEGGALLVWHAEYKCSAACLTAMKTKRKNCLAACSAKRSKKCKEKCRE